jgi:C4-dicarboxylate transporter DctM subunit
MSAGIVFLLLFVAFGLFLIFGMPIAVAIGTSSFIILLIGRVPLVIIPQRMFAGMDSFALIAVPFFILAGDLMSEGKTSGLIMDFIESLLGFLRGALWPVAVLTAMVFAGISGSSAADTAAVAGALIPELKRRKYDEDFSSALIASAGSIGIVIPPSVPMILYAFITYASVSKLFLNGFIPGTLMGVTLAAIALRKAYKEHYTRSGRLSFRDIWTTFRIAIWGLLTPIIILGGIFSGKFTPSESAVIAVDWAIIVSLYIYRDKGWKDIFRIIGKSMITASLVMFLISTARVFAWILADWSIPALLANGILSISTNKFVIILLIDLILLIAGVFLETASIIIIFTPLLFGLATSIGIDPVHFGIIEVVALAIGMVTPPVAINLYVVSGVTGIPIERISKAEIPLLLALIGILMLVTYLPIIFPKIIF